MEFSQFNFRFIVLAFQSSVKINGITDLGIYADWETFLNGCEI